MGFKVNPERWLPTGQYLRLMWEFATTHAEDNPYNTGRNHQTQFQRRMGKIKTFDGPIHTLWVWETRVRYNWFTIGYHCWRKGHDFGKQTITVAPATDLVPQGGGVIRFVPNGKHELHQVTVCRYCGLYRGHSKEEVKR